MGLLWPYSKETFSNLTIASSFDIAIQYHKNEIKTRYNKRRALRARLLFTNYFFTADFFGFFFSFFLSCPFAMFLFLNIKIILPPIFSRVYKYCKGVDKFLCLLNLCFFKSVYNNLYDIRKSWE